MIRALATRETARDPIATAHLHATLRFATGITVAFLLCEYMQWDPTYIAPLFTGAMITMLPGSPPLKVGIALLAAMGVAVLIAFLLVSLLHNTPTVMFGFIGIILFLGFGAFAYQRATMAALLVLISIATIPIVGMLGPPHAGNLARAFVAAMAIALVTLWCVYLIWPAVLPRTAQPTPAPKEFPIRSALAGTMVVMPLMLVYLLFGWSDVLPVMTSTVILVTHLDPKESAAQGLYRSTGSLIGGLIALVAFLLLSIMPSLITLGLITFVIGLVLAPHAAKGGVHGAIGMQVFTNTFILFGKAISAPDNSAGLWLLRVTEFALAGLFAVAMMHLFFRSRASAAD